MLCVPPQQSAGQGFISKWKENHRFPVSSYRSKNSSITAADNENNSVESETHLYETTITENYSQETEIVTDSGTDEISTISDTEVDYATTNPSVL